MNNLKKVIIILLIIFSTDAYSQKKGFAGKIHQVQFDAGRVYWGYYTGEYKLSVWKHFGFALHGGLIKKSQSLNYDPYSYGYSYGYGYGYGNNSISRIKCEGMTVGVGIVYNSVNGGMPMPLGFYTGLYFVMTRGIITQSFPGQMSTREFDFNTNLIKSYFGKNIFITNYFTLDLGFSTGLIWGSTDNTSAVTLPSRIFFRKFASGDQSFSKLYLLPEVKIGYLF